MTASVQAPVTAAVSPGLVTTPHINDGVARMPSAELPEILNDGAVFPSAAMSELIGISEDPFNLDSKFAYTPHKMKVFTIGAGFSGLLMAHKFQHRFPEMRDIVEHTIFEAHSEVGGTWFINNYPGVQCDVPAHIYAFPFDPNPNWSRFYASGPEILEYIKSTVRKWNLDRDLQLNTRVIGAQWQEAKGQWKVTVEHEGKQREEHCHVLISAQGVLVHESWPDIPGLRDFEGHITHSALWDHNYDYSNRKVAVIGNGSSGIQIVPQMQKLPGTDVVNFIRGQAWVYYRAPPSKHLGRDDPDPNPKYTDAEREMFQDPDYHLQHRKGIISRTNKSFHIFMKGKNNEEGIKLAAAQMAEKLGHDSKLCDMLIPKWELGCRRITPGPGYLESFLQPNCNVTNSPITNISKKGVHTADGKLYECDVIVCATGFDVSHRPRYPIVGKKKVDLATRWADDPDSYISVAIPDYPNYFMMMGPNCLGGHGSLVESLNWTGDYFIKWIKKMATEDIKYVEPKQEVVDAFIRYSDQVHKTLVWSGGCKSWYKRNRVDGRVTALFGGSAHLFNRMLNGIRAEDFNICYRTSNPFRFMGNGFTAWEMDPKNDLSWYVEKADKVPDACAS
ncbi:putative sterigmatocystin biosynthesis monooxygenase [Colletotrichum fructicola]|uniref:Cyclohexanone-monooxygenase n=1 Tax=Colletotrichum fructicola (strain Nara gc5) TaxID=1213859 RepID=L2GDJ8_COLFN|nr:putative sterigmatocystin biosynthesis monooxygenase [Colletotrichum fructicola]KAF4485338.1 putative sterigmatocystin biosynthesis monooxygenase stcW [Colletotrichum fructicola Nara gc5]KAE9582661.1 putative sterigmatocystin biosynthesis monooxygenase [Colletotrichum fructicola]KAF4431107.1 putative sterigmatocystin biosynthesis monooxygenase stcW [Colletotrichum fructicola]KAF4890637.1 putative sterigmatocystin biosynthesis monooxygenase stcW [Colletotrichum fructicola]KAF4936401.1 putati